MDSAIKIVVVAVGVFSFQFQAIGMTIENSTGPTPGISASETSLSGVISKVDASKLEINGVTYSFNPLQAKLFDLNGKQNSHLEIKPGMFVNFKVDSVKDALRIVELRMVRP